MWDRLEFNSEPMKSELQAFHIQDNLNKVIKRVHENS